MLLNLACKSERGKHIGLDRIDETEDEASRIENDGGPTKKR
jgi:hypothetical protein